MSSSAQFYSGAKKIRKKIASLSTIIPPACVHGETTQEPRSILKKRLIQSLDKVLKITFQHKAVLIGLQYEDQNFTRKIVTVTQRSCK